MSADNKMPSVVMMLAPCAQCGARTERQAETMCKATQGIDGDYHCAGEFDARGRSVTPTPESIRAIDEWCQREAERNGW